MNQMHLVGEMGWGAQLQQGQMALFQTDRRLGAPDLASGLPHWFEGAPHWGFLEMRKKWNFQNISHREERGDNRVSAD
jgi:hypothetical protein